MVETSAVLVGALERVEAAAREVDALFGEPMRNTPRNLAGFPLRWRFDGHAVSEEASMALLSLHDHLNDVQNARELAEYKQEVERG